MPVVAVRLGGREQHQAAIEQGGFQEQGRVQYAHLEAFAVANHGHMGDFTARPGGGRDADDRKGAFRNRLPPPLDFLVIQFGVGQQQADCFGAIQHRAAADGDHMADGFSAHDLQRGQHIRDIGVAGNAGIKSGLDSGVLQGVQEGLQQPRFFDSGVADDEDTVSRRASQFGHQIGFGVVGDDEFGREVKG
jgi:hypothetical protein